MPVGPTRTRFPFCVELLFWVVVAMGYVWLLGPPADWSDGRPPMEREATELAEVDSLPYDPEAARAPVVSPRRFTAEVLAAVGFPLETVEAEVPLAYRQPGGAERAATH